MKILKLTMVEEFKKGAKMEKKLTLHTNGYQASIYFLSHFES